MVDDDDVPQRLFETHPGHFAPGAGSDQATLFRGDEEARLLLGGSLRNHLPPHRPQDRDRGEPAPPQSADRGNIQIEPLPSPLLLGFVGAAEDLRHLPVSRLQAFEGALQIPHQRHLFGQHGVVSFQTLDSIAQVVGVGESLETQTQQYHHAQSGEPSQPEYRPQDLELVGAPAIFGNDEKGQAAKG